MSSTESTAIKQREHDSWMSVAAGWHRRDELLRKGGAPVTEWLLARAGIADGHQVLDIASGTGEPAISAAHLVGRTGRVIGTDLVEEMLVFAREKAQQLALLAERELESIPESPAREALRGGLAHAVDRRS